MDMIAEELDWSPYKQYHEQKQIDLCVMNGNNNKRLQEPRQLAYVSHKRLKLEYSHP